MDIAPMMENQMQKNMDKETGIIPEVYMSYSPSIPFDVPKNMISPI